MHGSPIDELNRSLMKKTINELERATNSDVLVYCGDIVDGVEATIKDVIEDLQANPGKAKHEKLSVLLTTGGGSLGPVKRMVNIFRNFYKEVDFIVPDYAYSAGTIMCCSGDRIIMSYYSVLGPIDPQVKNKDGNLVAALGYLDKVEELICKAKNNELTDAEFLILKDFDLAELRAYEQARDLAIDLLKEWLPKYKFKDWDIHGSHGGIVTEEEKISRAMEIANNLSDNKEWKSHGRPINRDELERLKLHIDKLEDMQEVDTRVGEYHRLMTDYVRKYNIGRFIHTRRFL